MASPNKIDRLVPKAAPTLLEASKGNELIDALNRLLDIEVQLGLTGTSRFIYSDNNIILYLNKNQLVSGIDSLP